MSREQVTENKTGGSEEGKEKLRYFHKHDNQADDTLIGKQTHPYNQAFVNYTCK